MGVCAAVALIFASLNYSKFGQEQEQEIDLLSNGPPCIKLDAEYFREFTKPKTVVDVKIRIDREEDGKLRTTTILSKLRRGHHPFPLRSNGWNSYFKNTRIK